MCLPPEVFNTDTYDVVFASGFRRIISEAITPSCVQPPLDGVGGHVEEDVPEVGHDDEVLPE